MRSPWIARLLIAAWALIAVVGLASLSLRHFAAQPQPRLPNALLALRQRSNTSFLVHVIYSECSCSRSLFAHLLDRRPFPGTEELILYIGTDAAKQQAAKQAGFHFNSISVSDLVSRFSLEAAPVLVVFDSQGHLRYAGGYYDHPAAIHPLDEKIHSQLSKGTVVVPLPIFGCAVSLI